MKEAQKKLIIVNKVMQKLGKILCLVDKSFERGKKMNKFPIKLYPGSVNKYIFQIFNEMRIGKRKNIAINTERKFWQ